MRELLASQLAEPVEFVAQIEAMYRLGARTFVEVGPDAKLIGLSAAFSRAAHIPRSPWIARAALRATSTIWPACSQPWPLSGMLSISIGGTRRRHREPVRGQQRGLTAKISGANAKTQEQHDGRSFREPPIHASTTASACRREPSPRFSIASALEPSPPTDFEPRQNGSIDATKEFSNRMNAQAENGHAANYRSDIATSPNPGAGRAPSRCPRPPW